MFPSKLVGRRISKTDFKRPSREHRKRWCSSHRAMVYDLVWFYLRRDRFSRRVYDDLEDFSITNMFRSVSRPARDECSTNSLAGSRNFLESALVSRFLISEMSVLKIVMKIVQKHDPQTGLSEKSALVEFFSVSFGVFWSIDAAVNKTFIFWVSDSDNYLNVVRPPNVAVNLANVFK